MTKIVFVDGYQGTILDIMQSAPTSVVYIPTSGIIFKMFDFSFSNWIESNKPKE